MEQNEFKNSYFFIWARGIKKCINVFYTLKVVVQAAVSMYVFREKVKIVRNFNLYVRNHQ